MQSVYEREESGIIIFMTAIVLMAFPFGKHLRMWPHNRPTLDVPVHPLTHSPPFGVCVGDEVKKTFWPHTHSVESPRGFLHYLGTTGGELWTYYILSRHSIGFWSRLHRRVEMQEVLLRLGGGRVSS